MQSSGSTSPMGRLSMGLKTVRQSIMALYMYFWNIHYQCKRHMKDRLSVNQVIVCLGLCNMGMHFNRTVISASIPMMQQYFSIGHAVMSLAVVFFCVPFVLAIVMTSHYCKRLRPTEFITLAMCICCLSSLMASMSFHFVIFLVSQAGFGIGDGIFTAVVFVYIKNLVGRKDDFIKTALFFISVSLGLSLGFVVGGIFASRIDWRISFLMQALCQFVLWIAVSLIPVLMKNIRGSVAFNVAQQSIASSSSSRPFSVSLNDSNGSHTNRSGTLLGNEQSDHNDDDTWLNHDLDLDVFPIGDSHIDVNFLDDPSDVEAEETYHHHDGVYPTTSGTSWMNLSSSQVPSMTFHEHTKSVRISLGHYYSRLRKLLRDPVLRFLLLSEMCRVSAANAISFWMANYIHVEYNLQMEDIAVFMGSLCLVVGSISCISLAYIMEVHFRYKKSSVTQELATTTNIPPATIDSLSTAAASSSSSNNHLNRLSNEPLALQFHLIRLKNIIAFHYSTVLCSIAVVQIALLTVVHTYWFFCSVVIILIASVFAVITPMNALFVDLVHKDEKEFSVATQTIYTKVFADVIVIPFIGMAKDHMGPSSWFGILDILMGLAVVFLIYSTLLYTRPKWSFGARYLGKIFVSPPLSSEKVSPSSSEFHESTPPPPSRPSHASFVEPPPSKTIEEVLPGSKLVYSGVQ